MSRITINRNPLGGLDLPQTCSKIPSGTPHSRSTVHCPPHHGLTGQAEAGECRLNFDTWTREASSCRSSLLL